MSNHIRLVGEGDPVRNTSDLKAKIEIFSQKQGGVIRFQSFNVSGGVSLERDGTIQMSLHSVL
jgi:adenine C2-methylase RlmN of 23S rRNA A2503 and tRNA A37